MREIFGSEYVDLVSIIQELLNDVSFLLYFGVCNNLESSTYFTRSRWICICIANNG